MATVSPAVLPAEDVIPAPALESTDAPSSGAPVAIAQATTFPPVAGLDAIGLQHCIVMRDDGVYADPGSMGQSFMAAYEHVMRANQFFTGLDYPLLLKALYGYGPALPERSAQSMLRFASGVGHFEMARRALYKNIKFSQGSASYNFEVPEDGAALTVDEFVAHLWEKGVRFGLDLPAIGAAIAAGSNETVVVARSVPPTPGEDARIIEVSPYLHRNDAPLELANGKLDMMAFQNRFPQIKAKSRLMQKLPAVPGHPGIDITGAPLLPPAPLDADLWLTMGDGTAVEVDEDGEFLIATRTGYLDLDPATHKISIGDKIVSRDGVSSRTTGNLTLKGDFEEYGEVQEMRAIEGEGIIIHGAVFGHIVSRGGDILLHSNLIGGTATNARGQIRIAGMASNAVIQSRQGDVVLQHADNCVISGQRVTIEHAVNCEIIADEVRVGHAEGCAIGGRRVSVGRTAPRKQSEMVVFALRPDSGQIDTVIAMMRARVEEFAAVAAAHKAAMEALTAEPAVARYVQLAGRVRKQELVLTPEQQQQFQKMAQSVAPALKAIAKVSADVKAAETERAAGQALVDQLIEQRRACTTAAHVEISEVEGDSTVRTLEYDPNAGMPHDLSARDIKQRLRTKAPAGAVIFAGSSGQVSWDS